MLSSIVDALKTVWDWFLSVITGIAAWAFEKVLSIIPGFDESSLGNAKSQVAFAISGANAWVPIDLIITLFTTYCAFVITYLAIKVAIKLIP